MDLQIAELDTSVIGERLGQKLYSPKGGLLLGMGAEIRDFHYRKIREVGYRSLYLLQPGHEDILDSSGHILSEKSRASAPNTLKAIYSKLLSKDKIEVSNGKKEMSALADSLIREVNVKMASPPDILDLKREEDYIYQHAINVAAYSILLGQSLHYHQLKLFDLALASLLHDFGMLFIDSEILLKPDRLDDAEIEEMRKHTILGFQHLGRNCFIKGTVTIVCLQHHERSDASGYPKAMMGEEMHEYAKIIALADFFDAYTSDRPWRRLHDMDEAIAYLEEQSGREFDDPIVQKFLRFFH